MTVTRDQLMRLLGQVGLRQIWNSRRYRDLEDEDDESEPDNGYGGIAPKRKRGRGRDAFEKVPSQEGRLLMESGTFGSNDRAEDTMKRKKRLTYQIMRRELGMGSAGRQRNRNRHLLQVCLCVYSLCTSLTFKQGLIPSSKADSIIHYNARCYSGQFSG
jgi:DDB1- and CUL4-associated factor 11